MDRKLRCEIAQVFAGESVRYHYEVTNEVWLTGVKLAEQIQFFSPSWLKRYGYLLPRERMVMVARTAWNISLAGAIHCIESNE